MECFFSDIGPACAETNGGVAMNKIVVTLVACILSYVAC